MKKMFGEHGWLGQSPDEKLEQNTRSKKSSISRNDGSSPRYQKKTTMIGKLKNKLEEFVGIPKSNYKSSLLTDIGREGRPYSD